MEPTGTMQERLREDGPIDHVVWIVWAHFFIARAHGLTHVTHGVPLAPWQMAYVGLFVVTVPMVGMWMMLNGRLRLGAGVVTVSMFLSLVFGIAFHFVFDTPDNICNLSWGFWTVPFTVTAFLVYLSELAGTVLAFRVFVDPEGER